MNEQWYKIPGYDGYLINNLGNVKSTKMGTDKLLKQCLCNGYYGVTLYKNGKRNHISVHRLMCMTFIPNPLNKPQVDHINGIKTDNRIENLHWVTSKENCNNPLRIEKFMGKNNHFYGKTHTEEARLKMSINNCRLSGKDNPAARQVINLTTGQVFDTIKQAGQSINLSDNAIRNSINRNHKCGGYKWAYVEEC